MARRLNAKDKNFAADCDALLNARALANLDRCDAGWCKVKSGSVSGWLPADQVWGVAATPQCR